MRRKKLEKELTCNIIEPKIYGKFIKCCETCYNFCVNGAKGFTVCVKYRSDRKKCIKENFSSWKHKRFTCDFCGQFNESSNNERCCYCGSK